MADREEPVDPDSVVQEGELIAVIVISILIVILLIIQVVLLIYCFCRKRCAQRFPCCKDSEKDIENERTTSRERLITHTIEGETKPEEENGLEYKPAPRVDFHIVVSDDNGKKVGADDDDDPNKKKDKKKKKKKKKKKDGEEEDEVNDNDNVDTDKEDESEKTPRGVPAEAVHDLEDRLTPGVEEGDQPRVKEIQDTDPDGRDTENLQGREDPKRDTETEDDDKNKKKVDDDDNNVDPDEEEENKRNLRGVPAESVHDLEDRLTPGVEEGDQPGVKEIQDTNPDGRDTENLQGREDPKRDTETEDDDKNKKKVDDDDDKGHNLDGVLNKEEDDKKKRKKKEDDDTDPDVRDEQTHKRKDKSRGDKGPTGTGHSDSEGEGKGEDVVVQEVTSSEDDLRRRLVAEYQQNLAEEEIPITRDSGHIRGRGRAPISDEPEVIPSTPFRIHVHPKGVTEAWAESDNEEQPKSRPKEGRMYLSPEEDQGFGEGSSKGSREGEDLGRPYRGHARGDRYSGKGPEDEAGTRGPKDGRRNHGSDKRKSKDSRQDGHGGDAGDERNRRGSMQDGSYGPKDGHGEGVSDRKNRKRSKKDGPYEPKDGHGGDVSDERNRRGSMQNGPYGPKDGCGEGVSDRKNRNRSKKDGPYGPKGRHGEKDDLYGPRDGHGEGVSDRRNRKGSEKDGENYGPTNGFGDDPYDKGNKTGSDGDLPNSGHVDDNGGEAHRKTDKKGEKSKDRGRGKGDTGKMKKKGPEVNGHGANRAGEYERHNESPDDDQNSQQNGTRYYDSVPQGKEKRRKKGSSPRHLDSKQDDENKKRRRERSRKSPNQLDSNQDKERNGNEYDDSGISDERESGTMEMTLVPQGQHVEYSYSSDVSLAGSDWLKYWPDDNGRYRAWDRWSADGSLEGLTVGDVGFDDRNRLIKSRDGSRTWRPRDVTMSESPTEKRGRRKARSRSRPRGQEKIKKKKGVSDGRDENTAAPSEESMSVSSEPEVVRPGRPANDSEDDAGRRGRPANDSEDDAGRRGRPANDSEDDAGRRGGDAREGNDSPKRRSKSKRGRSHPVRLGRGLPAGAVLEGTDHQGLDGGEETPGHGSNGGSSASAKDKGGRKNENKHGGTSLSDGGQDKGEDPCEEGMRGKSSGRQHGSISTPGPNSSIWSEMETEEDGDTWAVPRSGSSGRGRGDGLVEDPIGGKKRRNKERRWKKRTRERTRGENTNSWEAFLQHDTNSEMLSPLNIIFLESDEDYR